MPSPQLQLTTHQPRQVPRPRNLPAQDLAAQSDHFILCIDLQVRNLDRKQPVQILLHDIWGLSWKDLKGERDLMLGAGTIWTCVVLAGYLGQNTNIHVASRVAWAPLPRGSLITLAWHCSPKADVPKASWHLCDPPRKSHSLAFATPCRSRQSTKACQALPLHLVHGRETGVQR